MVLFTVEPPEIPGLNTRIVNTLKRFGPLSSANLARLTDSRIAEVNEALQGLGRESIVVVGEDGKIDLRDARVLV
jgi:hypothetical protein